MLITCENSVKTEKESCKIFEYEFPYQKLGCCKAIINGKYPATGFCLNLKCDQIYFIISGCGIIFYDDKYFKIKEGDCFFMLHGKKYRVEGENLTVIIFNSPKWSLVQYKHIAEELNANLF